MQKAALRKLQSNYKTNTIKTKKRKPTKRKNAGNEKDLQTAERWLRTEGTEGSFRGSRLDSQDLHSSAQTSITIGPEDPRPSSGLKGLYRHMVQT